MEFAAWNSLYSVMTAQQERRPFSWATVRRILAFARPRRGDAGRVPGAQRGRGGAGRGHPAAGRPGGRRDLVNQQSFTLVWQLALLIAVIAVVEAAARPAVPVAVGPDRRGADPGPAAGGLRPRAEDADRLLHPDPDRRAGQPAEQRRHRGPARVLRHPVRGGRQPGRPGADPGRDARGSPGRSPLLALVLLPIFVLPARRMGRRLARLELEAANHNSAMSTQMTERFSAPGATLVKLFARPERESAEFGARAEPGARHRRPDRDGADGLHDRPDAGLRAGPGAGLRTGRVLRAARDRWIPARWSRWRC